MGHFKRWHFSWHWSSRTAVKPRILIPYEFGFQAVQHWSAPTRAETAMDCHDIVKSNISLKASSLCKIVYIVLLINIAANRLLNLVPLQEKTCAFHSEEGPFIRPSLLCFLQWAGWLSRQFSSTVSAQKWLPGRSRPVPGLTKVLWCPKLVAAWLV